MKKILNLCSVLILVLACSVTMAACGKKDPGATATAPGAVASFSVTANEDNNLVINWTKPASDGGSDITKYEATFDNWTTTVNLNKTATSFTFSYITLTDGQDYALKIRAVNEIGAGAEKSLTFTVVQLAFEEEEPSWAEDYGMYGYEFTNPSEDVYFDYTIKIEGYKGGEEEINYYTISPAVGIETADPGSQIVTGTTYVLNDKGNIMFSVIHIDPDIGEYDAFGGYISANEKYVSSSTGNTLYLSSGYTNITPI